LISAGILISEPPGPGVETLAGVLGQCTALTHLDLNNNGISESGTDFLAGVLTQGPALTHHLLDNNWIGHGGTAILAGVLGHTNHEVMTLYDSNCAPTDACAALDHAQGAALTHLDLSINQIGTVGEGRLRDCWCGETSDLFL